MGAGLTYITLVVMPLYKTTLQRLQEAENYGRAIDDALNTAQFQYAQRDSHLHANLENIRKDTRSLIEVLKATARELDKAPNA